MADELKDGNKPEVTLEEVVLPTLFIALGGTGAEVLWRVRRRILNTLWGAGQSKSIRLDSLTEFPLAQFLHIDLDSGTVTQQGKAQQSDILSNQIAFQEEEKLIKKLDVSTYIKTDDDLAKYPKIQEWFPLSRSKVNELNINVETGAGQIRALSRLYFFDKYQEIKNAIRTKASYLLSDVSTSVSAKRLGLKIQTKMLKIIVVASTAGGTGSGSFLDLGYLAQIIGKIAATDGLTTNLILMLPTGYEGANLAKTQANTYAALMELETCMRQGSRYIQQWSEKDVIRNMPENPYDNVYLIDTANLAGSKTKDIQDLYEMIADALFEDFSTSTFANKKRSVIVNQSNHKTAPYTALVNTKKYPKMKLTFSRGYSSFGQATIDIHLDQKKNIILLRQVNEMLKAFFGVASNDPKSNIPTEGERDDLLVNRMHLSTDNDIINYDFIANHDHYKKGVERTTFPIVRELLRVNGIIKLDDIEKRIIDKFEEIRTGGNYKEWPTKIAEIIANINHDTFKAVESGSGLHEEAIFSRRDDLLAELLDANRKDGLIRALWDRVDNKERGGLDYTIELIIRIKDRLENANTGLIKILEENSKWYSDLSGFLRKEETDRLQQHLLEAIKKTISAKTQAEMKLRQIAEAVKLYVRYHLYAMASREATFLLLSLSEALGKQLGTDADGNPLWGGFIGEMEEGRNLVRAIISDADNQIARTDEAMKQDHAMYFVLPAPKSRIDDLELLPPLTARRWAEEAFQDLGKTQQLFLMLRNDKSRVKLISKLMNRALNHINSEGEADKENPLFIALKEYKEHNDLGQLFSDFMKRAMPWVAASVNHYLKENQPNDQYKCYIGVKDSNKFKGEYFDKLKEHIPGITMMTEKEIGFVEIDTPGKLVCYTELTGLPLPSLKSLDDWYTSYRIEKDITPVNTHRRTSTFVHPRELTPAELDQNAEDFKLFVQAIALGVLTRTEYGEEADLYKLKIKGQTRYVGDEKRLRSEGFDSMYRTIIQKEVDLDKMQLSSSDQLAMFVVLMDYYLNSVYPLAVPLLDGVTTEQKSLPTLMCEQLVEEWTNRLKLKTEEIAAEQLLRSAREVINRWTNEISGSTSDVYQYEVNFKEVKPKRILKREVLKADWSLSGDGVSIKCPSCGKVIQKSFKLCPYCGYQVEQGPSKDSKCHKCGEAIQEGFMLCPHCGAKTNEIHDSKTQAVSTPSSQSYKEKLKDLKELLDDGLLTEDEYKIKREEIIKQI